jgi:hypothetical protein
VESLVDSPTRGKADREYRIQPSLQPAADADKHRRLTPGEVRRMVDDIEPATGQLAWLVEDPDAPGGTFIHWIMWRIDPGQSSLAEREVPAGAVQGTNDFGRLGYGGPCPPPGAAVLLGRLSGLDQGGAAGS